MTWLLPEISIHILLLASGVAFAGGLVKSTTGFGFALVSLPILLLVWEPIYAVPVIIPLAFVIDLLIVLNNRKSLDPKRIAPMIVAGLLGIPLGAYVLLVLASDILSLAIGVLVTAAGAALLFGLTINIKNERVAGSIAGFVSGIMASSMGLAGPAVSLFMINQMWEKRIFRTNISSYFLCIDTFTMLAFALTGTLSLATMQVSILLLLPVLLSYGLATRILPYINQKLFRRLATVVIMSSGMLAVIEAAT